jgi:hypothetical protein
VVLYTLGARGFHHREFSTFLALVLALAIAIVILFAATSTPTSASSERVEE